MHKKFEINGTKIQGGCLLGNKLVTHNSRLDLLLVLHMSDVPFLMLVFQIMASVYDGKNVQSVIFNASTFISQNLFFGTTVF